VISEGSRLLLVNIMMIFRRKTDSGASKSAVHLTRLKALVDSYSNLFWGKG
jgi:hypothetical protein